LYCATKDESSLPLSAFCTLTTQQTSCAVPPHWIVSQVGQHFCASAFSAAICVDRLAQSRELESPPLTALSTTPLSAAASEHAVAFLSVSRAV
jgi:hypothetical protein